MAFPNKIRVSGLPFMLQGWNNVYIKTGEMSDDCPVYKLDSYTLYGVFPIIGVSIFRRNGIWVMQRECDGYPNGIHKYGESPQPDPFGYWSDGAYVTPA